MTLHTGKILLLISLKNGKVWRQPTQGGPSQISNVFPFSLFHIFSVVACFLHVTPDPHYWQFPPGQVLSSIDGSFVLDTFLPILWFFFSRHMFPPFVTSIFNVLLFSPTSSWTPLPETFPFVYTHVRTPLIPFFWSLSSLAFSNILQFSWTPSPFASLASPHNPHFLSWYVSFSLAAQGVSLDETPAPRS